MVVYRGLDFECLKDMTKADLVLVCEAATAHFRDAGWLEPGEYFIPEPITEGGFRVQGGRFDGAGPPSVYKSIRIGHHNCGAYKWPFIHPESVMEDFRQDATVVLPAGTKGWTVLKSRGVSNVKWTREQLQVFSCALGCARIFVTKFPSLKDVPRARK